MRCLMCGKELGEGSIRDIFVGEDGICEECRKQWLEKNIKFELDGIKGEADYIYNKAFSSSLIQFKECGDEALKDIFLFEVKKKIRRKYRGYTLCCMPSSIEKRKSRGFSHLEEMYSCLNMKIIDPFIKNTNESQKQLPGYLRSNMRHEIVLKEGIQLPKKILLVDDTITSGSTLKGALSCIDTKKHHVRIYCVSANTSWDIG